MIEAVLIGAGNRGMFAYASYALKHDHEVSFIAVAEPNEERRLRFANDHNIPKENQFASWEELLDQKQLCEALVISTQDKQHYEPTMRALEVGYDILLEKPMSPDPLETLEMAEKAEKLNRSLTVCHVLRYSTFFSELKRLVDEGRIGDIMSVQWNENVGVQHHAHSFVRGNWSNSGTSSPMLLQKSCHDIDLLLWLIDGECTTVSSFGSLTFFNEKHAPEGSTDRCTDGCVVEHECPFSAIKLYHNEKDNWPQNVVTLNPNLDERMKAIKEGPYGKCVYRSDNNVVDHQVVNLEFDNEVTVAFTMSAFTDETSRTFKIMGTKGEIHGSTAANELKVNYFTGRKEIITPERIEGGHGGADNMIMRDFIQQSTYKRKGRKTSGKESAKSHLIAFAAEKSRDTGQTIRLNDFMSSLKKSQLN
ncbi:Gfo/Idh/MocA family oxidoreductase [Halobacillus shinanisalinarum]|uniref:Gfo/Idh/MocA family oxidoreductase n=1 Tax=Halobacillus shinanisalinarum TaxID=2932258 RepID=A0ABY4GUW3_9BACI|nr:Gfo/Idh/MocA family oxidoreductase [Halobacillus shinanisalinarum]UOQ91946.1 Gfo/Idh/MocA family oxidoreductase [Halobacillus shinanisalinarum]